MGIMLRGFGMGSQVLPNNMIILTIELPAIDAGSLRSDFAPDPEQVFLDLGYFLPIEHSQQVAETGETVQELEGGAAAQEVGVD